MTTVHAYDVLDTVHVHAHVRARGDTPADPIDTVFECTTSVPGTGESDPRLWLQDALVALLERL